MFLVEQCGHDGDRIDTKVGEIIINRAGDSGNIKRK